MKPRVRNRPRSILFALSATPIPDRRTARRVEFHLEREPLRVGREAMLRYTLMLDAFTLRGLVLEYWKLAKICVSDSICLAVEEIDAARCTYSDVKTII